MKNSVDAIKELRDITCSSIAHCKKALEEAKGDIKQAVVLFNYDAGCKMITLSLPQ